MSNIKKIVQRETRHKRIRRKVKGSDECLRLNVYRSVKHIYAQVINDLTGKTLFTVSSLSTSLKDKIKSGGNIGAAKLVGEEIASIALAKGIKRVVFDRGGYLFHGRVKALADAARAKGLVF